MFDGLTTSTTAVGNGNSIAQPRVTFSYAVAPPHRLTVAQPDSSHKTLLDVENGRLTMSWSYDGLSQVPPATWTTPLTRWKMILLPEIDGHAFARSTWARMHGYLPALDNTYYDTNGSVHLEVIAGASAVLTRIQVTNTGDQPHRLLLWCGAPSDGVGGENPGWIDPEQVGNILYAGFRDRADRVLIMGIGADEYPIDPSRCPRTSHTMGMAWNLSPGETRIGWIILPYRAFKVDVQVLQIYNWDREFEDALTTWNALLSRASKLQVPDADVENSFYACLGDLFVMREPMEDGCFASIAGTELYRAANSIETTIVAVALDQLGLHAEAESGFRLCLEQQGPDGEWADPQGWSHLLWCASGFKSWAIMEHYRLTGDWGYLENVYPQMIASSRWQERQRKHSRRLQKGVRPLTYGLLPPGMGDAGLKDDESFYGVFLPHNIWAVYADKLSIEAAEILGMEGDIGELQTIYQVAYEDLMYTLENGAITEKGYRWLPGVPGKTSGSRWGTLNAAFPCQILPANHDLISGTLQQIESQMSPGGLPLNTGWMSDGIWAAIALDNLAEVHLVRGNGDAASEYLYRVLNHGSPLYTWCEERGQEAGTQVYTGDQQHLWTPVALLRAIRDSLIMEDGDSLHLARGIARSWLTSGKPVGIDRACTHFGTISYQVQYDPVRSHITGYVSFPYNTDLRRATLHLRLPHKLRLISLNMSPQARILLDGSGIQWEFPQGEKSISVIIGR